MRETVVRIRAEVGVDRNGNQVRDWATADRLDIDGASVAPRAQGEETEGGREGVIIGWTVYVPRLVDVVATDRIEVRGEECVVDGQPGDWRSPFTNRKGTEIRLRRVVG